MDAGVVGASATGAATASAVAAHGALVEDATGADRVQPVPDLSPGRGAVAGCVFCHPDAQPTALAETQRVRLVPDLFPLAQGHLLVISREHLPCYGAADDETLAELDDLSALARRFIQETYGIDPLLWENGVSGQSVYHAHLHLIPLQLEGFVDALAAADESVEIDGWDAVRERYRQEGQYHYASLHDRRWLLEGNSVTNWEVRRLLAIAAGLRLVDGQWTRATTSDDVAMVATRYREWSAGLNPASG
jgi:diadenosine tetraphosphate (Ap4A) HIT family hydrolase